VFHQKFTKKITQHRKTQKKVANLKTFSHVLEVAG